MLCRLLFSILLLCLAQESWAINLLAPPQVVPSSTGEAVVRWKIDSPAGGKIRYGISPDRLEHTASGEVGIEHALTLKGLKPGTKYFYSIGTAKHELTTGSFIAGGTAAPGKDTPSRKTTIFQKITGFTTKPTDPKPTTLPPVAPKVVVQDAPATRRTWGNISSLQDHFDRHGGDFGAKSPDDYAAQAWRFRERATTEHLPMKLDTDGSVRAFDPKTRAFASFNRDGTTKTYFRPDSASYWQRQPGKPIQTPPWISQ